MSISILLAPWYKGGIPPSLSSSLKALPASLASSTCLSDCLLPPLSSGRISSPSFPEILSLYPQELFSLRNKPLSAVLQFSSQVVSDCFATPWTVAHQAPLSMGFPRQKYWSGWPFPTPGNLSNPGIEPKSSAFQMDSLPLGHLRSPLLVSRFS